VSAGVCTSDPNCDCEAASTAGCDPNGCIGSGLRCGSELGCNLGNDIYQCSPEGNFCHIGPCKNGCVFGSPSKETVYDSVIIIGSEDESELPSDNELNGEIWYDDAFDNDFNYQVFDKLQICQVLTQENLLLLLNNFLK
ncbi:15016_t:CDS:2, partial [Entrophospora sp. SA101]